MHGPTPRADLASAAAWIGLGGAIVYASWTMDRFERHGAALYTAPALVPGLLGVLLLLLGVVLGIRALRSGALLPRPAVRISMGNTLVVLILCLGYAIGFVGRTPFWLATFLFVSGFIAVFEYPALRRMATAPLYGAATAFIVTYLFESVFLVRLP